MQAESRARAQRHMWLSWLWGMYGVWGLSFICGIILSITTESSQVIAYLKYGFLIGLAVPMAFLGLPALLGVFLRRAAMQRIFAAPTSLRSLMLRTGLVFEGSVLLCWLLWELFTFFISPLSFKVLPRQHLLSTTIAFFGLSLPWLLSSVAAAWWVTRPQVSDQPK